MNCNIMERNIVSEMHAIKGKELVAMDKNVNVAIIVATSSMAETTFL